MGAQGCLFEEGSQFCQRQVVDGKVGKCSACSLAYRAAMLDSPYGRIRYRPSSFSELLSYCNVSPSLYPYTDPATASPTPTATQTGPAPWKTCCGTKYPVQKGDTCDSIAASHSISTARFWLENHLGRHCTVHPGQEVCLGFSCALYTVKPRDTCQSILDAQNATYSMVQLRSWNP